MTTVDHRAPSQQEVLEEVRALAPAIAARAAEIEAGRRIPRDLLGDLMRTGAFRILRPPGLGGAGADLPAALRAFEALARADGSVGWTVMIGSASWCDLASLPGASLDELFADRPDAITAGVFSPSGSIAPTDDGYRVSGRWGFASGCEHADWIYGNCVEAVVDGVPQLRIAVLPSDQVVIEDTWSVSGLRGTGSHHFHVDGATVPAERTLDPLVDPPSIDVPIVRVPVPALAALAIASVALGCAKGALDDVVSLAAIKVPLLASGRLAASATFQHELARADTELRAARALIHDAAETAWATATAARTFTLEGRARIRAAAAWAADRAAAVVGAAYRLGGGSAIYAANPLQRRFRDVNTLTQHFLVRPDTLTTAGAILAGQEPGVLIF